MTRFYAMKVAMTAAQVTSIGNFDNNFGWIEKGVGVNHTETYEN